MALHKVPKTPCIPIRFYRRYLGTLFALEHCLKEAFTPLRAVPLLQVVYNRHMEHSASTPKAMVPGDQLPDVHDLLSWHPEIVGNI